MPSHRLQIASFWRKVQELRAIGIDPTSGFALHQLDRAILSGADLGRQYFYTYDKPDPPSPDDPGSSSAPFAG